MGSYLSNASYREIMPLSINVLVLLSSWRTVSEGVPLNLTWTRDSSDHALYNLESITLGKI